jgi:hypothetical protein
MYRIIQTRFFFMNVLYTVCSKFLGMRNKIIIGTIITIILPLFFWSNLRKRTTSKSSVDGIIILKR